MPDDKNNKKYWNANVRILVALLSIWFTVSFLLSIVFVDALDAITFGGFKLGFWMSQQGAIYVFVILIFVYIKLMDVLDRKYHVEEESDPESPGKTGRQEES